MRPKRTTAGTGTEGSAGASASSSGFFPFNNQLPSLLIERAKIEVPLTDGGVSHVSRLDKVGPASERAFSQSLRTNWTN